MAADQSPRSPREQILEAVLACIEKYGIDSLTTRKIAEEAGTNIASINYYFRSKDLLVAEALSMAVQHMLEDVREIVERPGLSLEEVIETVLVYLIEGALRYPGTSLAHIYGIIVEKRYDTPAAQTFRLVFNLLAQRAAQEHPNVALGNIHAALSEVLSSALFTMLAPGLFHSLTPLDLSQLDGPQQSARYLTQVFMRSLEIRPQA